jgi:hypothetical protein
VFGEYQTIKSSFSTERSKEGLVSAKLRKEYLKSKTMFKSLLIIWWIPPDCLPTYIHIYNWLVYRARGNSQLYVVWNIPQHGWLWSKHSTFDPRIEIAMPNSPLNIYQKCHLCHSWLDMDAKVGLFSATSKTLFFRRETVNLTSSNGNVNNGEIDRTLVPYTVEWICINLSNPLMLSS